MSSLPRLLASIILLLPLIVMATDPTCQCNGDATQEEEQVIRILNLKTKSDFAFMGIKRTTEQYYKETGIKVELDWINDKHLWAAELKAQLQPKLPLYDGFVLPSHLIGYAAQFDGFMDLTVIVRARPGLSWADIFLGFRDNVAVYDNRVYLFPIDGDANFTFYRSDVLEHFNLTVPRTWEEYWQVAKAVHLQEYNDKTMYGLCLGRKAGEGAGAFWAMDVLSSYTQTKGKSGGFLFDPSDLSPLMGEAIAEAIKMLEMQVRYGHPDEFGGEAGGEPGSINVVEMNRGKCCLTINWGDSFTQSYSSGSQVVGLMNVAPLPGADKVLNKETMTLEPCAKENCGGLGGREYSDIGWVNTAQFLAGGRWAGAVNNNVDLVLDPFRASHFDIPKWVEAGYDREAVESYEEAVLKTAANPNAAIDIRFAGGDEIYNALADEVQKYLELTRLDKLPESEEEKQQLRLQTAERISERFTRIVNEQDAKPEISIPILEQYQRDLGIFRPEVNYNQIGDLLIVYFVLLTITLACLLGFALWVFVHRSNKVVQYSQPIFLYLLCAGTFVMGCAILPLSIDNSFFNQTTGDCPGCNKACVAWPWLVCTGFSIKFSTLFSKVWRLNQLIKASIQFRRIECKPKDVMRPFAVIFSMNIFLLLCWTLFYPTQYQRIWTDALNSYGTCRPYGTGNDGDTSATTAILSLLTIVNFSALFLAQFQAFKARHITCEVLSESKYISLAIYGNLQIFLIGFPLFFIVKGNPSAKYFLQVGTVFVVCMGILLLIFGPKIYYAECPPPDFDIRETIARRSTGGQVSVLGNSTVQTSLSKQLANKEIELEEMKEKLEEYKLLCKNHKLSEMEEVLTPLPLSDVMLCEVVENAPNPEPEPKV